MVAIYHAMGGTDWQQDQNWLSEEPVGAWYGVTTDDDGCVTRLELRNNELSGEIPSEWGSISRLRVLNLSNNNRLTGEIPAELGNLSLLEHLDLSDQTGQTDRSYALSGEIPEELGNLSNLKSLKLSWHALGGELPPQLGNLGHLESLNVQSNNLSGEIPSGLGRLPKLRLLILGWNDLSGEIPSELGSIATLEWLDLSGNNLSGQIPPDLSSLTNLERLDLQDNNLSGRMPPELGSLSSLTTLRLDNNSLEDGIPAELGGLSNLNTLNLSDNQLSGEIPRTLGGMRELATLDLSDSNLSGSIPEEFGGLSKLESLYLRENSLSGSIPVELAKLPALRQLFVAGNEFTSCIPPELRALERNRLWDPVRSWLGFSLPRNNTDLHKLGLPYCSVPPNQQYASEGSAIRVSWDPVERADYHTVYHDDFFSSSCTLDIDDNPLFCEELATNVVGTTYLHADPSDGDNYYWVVAWGGDECSDISSRNSATRVGTESTGPASTNTDAPAEAGVSGLANVRYAHEGSAIRVSWDPVDGADHYNVYHDDFRDSGCTLNRNGSPRLCDELATNVTEATYLHTAPSGGSNYYWVAACTSMGCSEIDSENPATPIEAIPSGPTNVRYAGEGSAIRVSWDPVRGADFYNIYHDDFQDSRCSLRRDGSPSFCDELATNISETTYLHTSPSDRNNYYWVVACNRGGCSEIDSENPATSAETDTTGQTDTTTDSKTSRVLSFTESEPATRSIPENTPGGINVGDPVSADADGALTHTMSGPDGGSFAIVPATGQIRTRDGVVYDYETKNRYEVTVGASESDGGSASIDVVIHIENLVPACEPIRNRRTNHGDGYVRVRWNPALQRDGKAGVLGYEVEMRRGADGPWSNRRTVPGRSIGSTIYDDLDSLVSYEFRVRPVAAEGDCGWSPPFLGIPAPYLPPIYRGDRFGTDPVGTSDRNWRFLTNGRCRYTSGHVTADANCSFHISGPDTSKVVLEFDDPSLGSCDVVLAFSSLTAGSFVDECFDAGVNTEVPFDRRFRMPRSGPQTEADVPRSPRSQEEFDVFAWGRDDLIPGLHFGCPPAFSCGFEFIPGEASRVERDPDTGLPKYILGNYTYENTGPAQGVLIFRDAIGESYVFTLDFNPSGNVGVTITDDEGDASEWPGITDLDLALEGNPILLPIPPSWSAAIAIESDYTPEELAIDSARESFIRVALVDPLYDHAICHRDLDLGCSVTLDFSQKYFRLGRNRAILTVEFRARDPEVFDTLEEPLRTLRKTLNGSTYSFDITYTADGAAEYTLTITKEGHVPVVKRGFVDFKGDSIDLDEFPEEIHLPLAPPQASGQDRSGVEVAAAISALRIASDELQTFLISDQGVQPASYQPGDWLEPKDGSNQRMMIAAAGPATAASSASSQGLGDLTTAKRAAIARSSAAGLRKAITQHPLDCGGRGVS